MTEPKLVETLVGELLNSDDEIAEIAIFEPKKQGGFKDMFYFHPVEQFREHSIADGDQFFLEVYDDGTSKIMPKIVYGPWQQEYDGPYDTPDQREALGNG